MLTQYYTASSVDGFITDEHESLDWLLSRDIDADGPMGYPGFRSGVGAMAMGASTYAWIRRNHHEPWPYSLPCWVFTHRDLPAADDGDIRFTAAPVAQVHAEMAAAAEGGNVWVVGGGDLVGQFADEGLLDEVWVQYAPVTLGAGAPLLPRRLELRLEAIAHNREFACARWSVVRPA
ncbi:MAG TPA: dihydrofolate reductase family protein [Marmoricola sp.]|nr:dihydrofolate reductase family protein [Marmoricola sp.]